MRRKYTPEERLAVFWSHVERSPDPNGCSLWTASVDGRGYGQFWDGAHLTRAHRFAWESTNGPIPDGLCVLHRCDVRRCCRVDHLFLGTKQDNARDMATKGRDGPRTSPESYPRGDDHWTRTRPENLARGTRNGMHTRPESRARGERNARYTHPERTARGERSGNALLTEDQVRAIRRECVGPRGTYKRLGAKYGVTPENVSFICRRKAWRHVE